MLWKLLGHENANSISEVAFGYKPLTWFWSHDSCGLPEANFCVLNTTVSFSVRFHFPNYNQKQNINFLVYVPRLRLYVTCLISNFRQWICSWEPVILHQGLWRIEYLNTGRAETIDIMISMAETEVCKQIGGRPCFYALCIVLLRMKRIACL